MAAFKDAETCKKDSVNISKRFQKNVKIFGRNNPLKSSGRKKLFGKYGKDGIVSLDSSHELFLDHNGERVKSKTPERLLKAFDPTPSRKVQEKIDFFFMPYNLESNVSKFMKFKSNDEEINQMLISKLIKISNDPYIPQVERSHAKK